MAVGIALIDTVLYGRTGVHIEAIRQRLLAGDVAAAHAIGLDGIPQDISAAGAAIEQAAFAASANEAWAMLAAIAVLGLLVIPLARTQRTDVESNG
jgi:DHA2 family multidrug resistance protein